MTSQSLGLVPLPHTVHLLPECPFPLTAATCVVSDTAPHLARDAARLLGCTTTPRAGAAAIRLELTECDSQEGYRIESGAEGVDVTARTPAGLFYATQTLRQLAGMRGLIPAAQIADHPRFAYRGFMLDVARHFMPVETVKAVIRRIAALKLNHLHLHLSDDQGWRLEILSRPELTRRAAASEVGGGPGGYYTQREFRELVAYAERFFVTVVPEIDMPGHTHAVSVAYPELAEPPALVPEVLEQAEQLGQSLPQPGEAYTDYVVGFSSLKIGQEETYRFVRDVLQEVASLTPGPFLHIGGDEAKGTSSTDFRAFVTRAMQLAAATGKRPIGWHEVGPAQLPPGAVGQYWGLLSDQTDAPRTAGAVVEKGGTLILSPGDAAYLDMKYDAPTELGLKWAGYVDVRQSYEWEPARVLDVPEEAILGVEAALWTETITNLAQLDSMVFPRLAGIAEAAWSAPFGGPGRTWEEYRARLAALGELWEADGISFSRRPGVEWR